MSYVDDASEKNLSGSLYLGHILFIIIFPFDNIHWKFPKLNIEMQIKIKILIL